MGAPGRASQWMGCHGCPRKGIAGGHTPSRGCACPKKGDTGDRTSQGPQEGCHRGWGGTGPVCDPGRALGDTGHRRARGCSGKGVTGDKTSCVLQEGCCGGWGGSGSLHPPRKGVVWDRASQDPSSPRKGCPRGQGTSWEGPHGVCHSWEDVAQMRAVVCPSHGCGGFATPPRLGGAIGVTWFITGPLQEVPSVQGAEPQPCVTSSTNPFVCGICCSSSFPWKGLKQ